MRARILYAVFLESIILGLLAAIWMAWVALDHNPQDEFYDAARHVVVVENLLPMMASWFIATAFIWLVLRLAFARLASKGKHAAS
jgi:Na+(H+)/acetate symporter ActP